MELVKGSDATVGGTVYILWTGVASSSTIATPTQMTGATVKFYVKRSNNDLDAAAILTINGTVVSTTLATVQAVITAAQTNALTYQGLVCEMVTKLSDGTFQRSGSEPFNLLPNVGKTLF
jgi:hypothetical protein